jgi:DNA-binding NtrC family response regulator
VNARIIAATNRNLEKGVQEGKFREDLFYRLKVITIKLPPLREREEDIILLAEYFLKEFVRKYGCQPKSFSELGIRAMKQYSWPGNVRELAHAIERAVLLSDNPTLSPANLGLETQPPLLQATPDSQLHIEFPNNGINLEDVERQLIEKALEITQGNVTEAARKLGVSREALRYRVQKHGIKIG